MEDQTAKEIREDYLTNPIYDGEVHQVIGGMSMEIQNLREEITRLKKEVVLLEDDIQEYVDAQPPL